MNGYNFKEGLVAVVTGASAGIGAATAFKLAEAGLVVVGIARRLDRLQVNRNTYVISTGAILPHSKKASF